MIRALVWVNCAVLIVCNIAVMLIVVAAALSRYVLNVDFFGTEEILMIFAFWLYFMGAAYGSYERSHVEADFVETWVGGSPAGRVLRFIRDIVELAVLLVLTYWAFLFIQFAFQRWPISPGWKIPMIVPQSAIFVGFVLMTLHALRHMWLNWIARADEAG